MENEMTTERAIEILTESIAINKKSNFCPEVGEKLLVMLKEKIEELETK